MILSHLFNLPTGDIFLFFIAVGAGAAIYEIVRVKNHEIKFLENKKEEYYRMFQDKCEDFRKLKIELNRMGEMVNNPISTNIKPGETPGEVYTISIPRGVNYKIKIV